jgi:hypothetical protein
MLRSVEGTQGTKNDLCVMTVLWTRPNFGHLVFGGGVLFCLRLCGCARRSLTEEICLQGNLFSKSENK